MKAILLNSQNSISLSNIPIPKIENDEVLVKVQACGICATDIDMYHGKPEAGKQKFPVVIGHEFSGIVYSVGENVENIKINERVSIDPNMGCGECVYCKRNLPQFCKSRTMYGFNKNGGLAEYCVVKAKQIYELDNYLSFKDATFAEPLGCCIHAFEKCLINSPKQIAIIGGGTLGTLLLQLVLKKTSTTKILVVEPNEEKQKRAMKMGATYSMSPSTENCDLELKKHGFDWIDLVFDCVGSSQSIAFSCENVSRGGQVILVGIPKIEHNSNILAFDIFRKEIIITGSSLNPNCHKKALMYLKDKIIDASVLYDEVLPIEESLDVIKNYNPNLYKQIVVF